LNLRIELLFKPTFIKHLVEYLFSELTKKKLFQYFTFTEKFLEDFYILISSKLQASNIKIIDIKNYPYMQKYVFQKGAFTAEIDFYYNSKKQFTRTIPQKNKSTSTELLNEIFELIKR
jgi:hypothetical protein